MWNFLCLWMLPFWYVLPFTPVNYEQEEPGKLGQPTHAIQELFHRNHELWPLLTQL